MNELSCIIVIAFGAARPGAPPSMAPAPAIAVIFSTSRRDAARMMLAIPASPSRLPPCDRRYEAATGQVNGSAVSAGVLAPAQQELAPELHHRHPVVLDDVRRRVGLVPDDGDEAAGADHVD